MFILLYPIKLPCPRLPPRGILRGLMFSIYTDKHSLRPRHEQHESHSGPKAQFVWLGVRMNFLIPLHHPRV